MSDVHEESTYTYAEMRDKVVLDLPDNSVKEHLSIASCDGGTEGDLSRDDGN